MVVGRCFFSAAQPAQNSPELQFYKFSYPIVSAKVSGLDQNTNELFSKISALASKIGEIKKIRAFYTTNWRILF